MEIRFGKLKGLEVLADREGRLLGTVRRLQLDSKRKLILGLVFKGKVMSGEYWCKVGGVQRIGEDVVFLTGLKAVLDDEPPGRDVKDLLGLPINTLDGKRLGSLEDLVIDTAGWQISSLVLDNGGVVPIGPDTVFGEDTILLRSGAADEVVLQPADQSGFLARVFHSEPPPVAPPRRKKR